MKKNKNKKNSYIQMENMKKKPLFAEYFIYSL